MINNFQLNGKWWLPSNQKEQIPGNLFFNQFEGPILDLQGSFDFDISLMKDGTPFYFVVLGKSSEGREITLLNCGLSEQTLYSGGSTTTKYKIDTVFIGNHLYKKEDTIFNEVVINYSFLEEWINSNSIFFKEDSEGQFIVGYKVYRLVADKINDDFLIKISKFKPDYWRTLNEINIKQKAALSIISLKKDFTEFKKLIDDLQNFLSFGIGVPVYPIKITAYKNGLNNPIDVYYKLNNFVKMPLIKLSPDIIFFNYEDFDGKFENYLRNWFEISEILKPTFNLYFSILYSPKMDLNQQFLSVILALESLHERTYSSKYVTENEFKMVYKNLTNAIPNKLTQDFKEKIKNTLSFINEFSLRDRLRDILNEYKPIHFESTQNMEKFIDKVIKTRNYLIHHKKELYQKAAKGDELFFLTQKLKLILEICLLSKLGFSIEKIQKLIVKNRWRKYISEKK